MNKSLDNTAEGAIGSHLDPIVNSHSLIILSCNNLIANLQDTLAYTAYQDRFCFRYWYNPNWTPKTKCFILHFAIQNGSHMTLEFNCLLLHAFYAHTGLYQ